MYGWRAGDHEYSPEVQILSMQEKLFIGDKNGGQKPPDTVP
jgi:hypothetical protein